MFTFVQQTAKKIVCISVLTVFIGAMFVSLFHMSVGMDMAGGMSDCLFMERGEVICPMNIADHIGAWKDAFVSVVPTIVTLVLAAGAIALVVSTAPFLLGAKRKLIPIQLNVFRTRTYSFSYRPLQELFSNGILHPKLF
ncbi:MAG: hypothetical protein R3B53_00885 [Candidatus Paceibacterota bacterium]